MRNTNQLSIGQMKHGELKAAGKELWQHNDFANIKEVNVDHDIENGFRIYCNQYPENFNLQIRTHKPIGEFGNGTSRDMIATISVTRKEIKAIYEYVMAYESIG